MKKYQKLQSFLLQSFLLQRSFLGNFRTSTNCFYFFLRFYTQKRPTGKAVPLPKISSFESNQPPYLNNINNNHQSQPSSDNNCNMKSSVNINNNVNSSQMNNNQQHQILPPPPPEPTTDENYAVTEL